MKQCKIICKVVESSFVEKNIDQMSKLFDSLALFVLCVIVELFRFLKERLSYLRICIGFQSLWNTFDLTL